MSVAEKADMHTDTQLAHRQTHSYTATHTHTHTHTHTVSALHKNFPLIAHVSVTRYARN